MTILITGGTGFLGSYLTRYVALEHPDEHVVVYDKFLDRGRIADVLDRVTLIEGDVADSGAVHEVFEHHAIDRVAHFAFVLGGPARGAAIPWVGVQCLGTANVLEAARTAGVQRLLFGSSVAIYGKQDAPVLSEDLVVNPGGNPYAAAKAWGESMARYYTDTLGLDTIVLRFGSTYGLARAWRGSYGSGLMTPPESVHYMARVEDAARGKAIVLPRGDAMADWLYAADAARASWLALTAPNPSHHVYNAGVTRLPVAEFAHALRVALPEASITMSDSEMPGHAHGAMATSRLTDDLGFTPTYSLVDGVRDYVERVRVYDAYREAEGEPPRPLGDLQAARESNLKPGEETR